MLNKIKSVMLQSINDRSIQYPSPLLDHGSGVLYVTYVWSSGKPDAEPPVFISKAARLILISSILKLWKIEWTFLLFEDEHRACSVASHFASSIESQKETKYSMEYIYTLMYSTSANNPDVWLKKLHYTVLQSMKNRGL